MLSRCNGVHTKSKFNVILDLRLVPRPARVDPGSDLRGGGSNAGRPAVFELPSGVAEAVAHPVQRLHAVAAWACVRDYHSQCCTLLCYCYCCETAMHEYT